MAIEELYRADFSALSRVVRKLNDIPDNIDNLKVLNAVAAELNNWIPRHSDAESMEFLTVITARLSPEAKPLPELVNDFRQILVQKNSAAAEEAVGGIILSFRYALEGLREFLLAKGIDPDSYEAPPPAQVAPAEVIPADEMLETNTIDGAEAPVETTTDPDLEPTPAAMGQTPTEPEPVAGYKCEFCGYQYQTPPGKFCDNCGRVIARLNIEPEDDSDQFRKCLKCGLRNDREAKLCRNCGELLRDQSL